jgi:hypothetical protein
MADWTIIVTTLGAASISGGLGYLTAKRSSDVALRGVEAENERLRTGYDEAHFQHRQAIYHDFLDSAYRFHQDAGGIEPFDRPKEYREWSRMFEHRLTAVRLFGTDEASHAAQRLADAISAAMAAPQYDGGPETRFLAEWEATIGAMRHDTAPPSRPAGSVGVSGTRLELTRQGGRD